jgi:threonylcarbamoyladenosine tRNA methylthiotransferase MtaB
VSSFYVENFGCRATQADGAAIERQFLDLGLDRAADAQQAQIVVLNSCTVTAAADHDVRAAIRRIHRQNPECRILVTGCYAQRAPQEVAALPGVSGVVGNSHKHQVAQVAANFVPLGDLAQPRPHDAQKRRAMGTPEILVGDIFAHTELMAAPVFDAGHDKTRPNLKIQDGCNNRCSFCVIPAVRGRSRSLPLAAVLREVEGLVASGYREIVLSGINMGRWGRDLRPQQRFEDLLRAVLERTAIEKLRLSSVEPMDWTEGLIALAAGSARIAKHAHVPMQSGSDRVLRQMHRKYRPWHYEDRIRRIRAAMPTAAIGADVMVGFPGETEGDFEATRAMVERLPFTYLHVFTYSARPGTPAAAMPAQVPVQVARERNRVLRELAAQKKQEFQRSFVGQTVEAITLSVFDGERTEALTDNYQKLWLQGRYAANQWVTARVRGVTTDGFVGEAV